MDKWIVIYKNIYFPWQIEPISERCYTYGEIKDSVLRVGSALWRLGVRKGTVVCVVLPNSVEYIITYIAVTAIGGILTDVNPSYKTGKG